MDPQLTNLAITGPELEAIEACLGEMREEVDATCLMLLDHSGQVIAAHTRRKGMDESTIGALLAGTFLSSRELARVLKEDSFTSLYQQGPRESIYAELIQGQWILAVVFRQHALLGMVRLASKRAAVRLGQIYEQVKIANRERDRQISERMRTSMKDALELLFGDREAGAGHSADSRSG